MKIWPVIGGVAHSWLGKSSQHKRSRHKRSLHFESLEPRQLLSASVKPAALWSYLGTLGAGYSYTVAAKAAPDEWFTGVGQPIVPYSSPQPTPSAKPRVNYDSAGGMAQTGGSIWFSSAANQAVGLGPGPVVPHANNFQVADGALSQYVGVPRALRASLGDWRPPKIYQYDLAGGTTTEMTPSDPLINRTLELRSVGANDELVLFAGPDWTMAAVNVFAFDAQTGNYLGSTTFRDYSDLGQWVNVNGQLYAGAARALSRTGEGAVIHWTGNLARPLSFEEVGRTDLNAVNIAVHENHLYVSTSPILPNSAAWKLGFRSTAVSGIWKSPLLGPDGLLTSNDPWQEVWDVTKYEADSTIAGTYTAGALHSFDGYLYWGTSGTLSAPQMFLNKYPSSGVRAADVRSLVLREATLFRAKNLGGVDSQDNPATEQIDLLYGDDQLWVYSPGPGTWALAPNNTGTPLFGEAGYRALPFNSASQSPKTRLGTYSMEVYQDHLFVGTEDFSSLVFGQTYAALNGFVNATQTVLYRNGYPDVSLGADLWMLSADQLGSPVAPVLIDDHGVGNAWNMGIASMVAGGDFGLFLSTDSASNLITKQYNPPTNVLKPGGWELIDVTAPPPPAPAPVVAKSVAQPAKATQAQPATAKTTTAASTTTTKQAAKPATAAKAVTTVSPARVTVRRV